MGLMGKVKKVARGAAGGAARDVKGVARVARNPVAAVKRDVSTLVHSTRDNYRRIDRGVFGGEGLQKNVENLRRELKRGGRR